LPTPHLLVLSLTMALWSSPTYISEHGRSTIVFGPHSVLADTLRAIVPFGEMGLFMLNGSAPIAADKTGKAPLPVSQLFSCRAPPHWSGGLHCNVEVIHRIPDVRGFVVYPVRLGIHYICLFSLGRYGRANLDRVTSAAFHAVIRQLDVMSPDSIHDMRSHVQGLSSRCNFYLINPIVSPFSWGMAMHLSSSYLALECDRCERTSRNALAKPCRPNCGRTHWVPRPMGRNWNSITTRDVIEFRTGTRRASLERITRESRGRTAILRILLERAFGKGAFFIIEKILNQIFKIGSSFQALNQFYELEPPFGFLPFAAPSPYYPSQREFLSMLRHNAESSIPYSHVMEALLADPTPAGIALLMS
jgi:hypothetical protein